MDIFAVAGLDKPDISILSDRVPRRSPSDLPQRNLAVELLQKLLRDEIKARSREEPGSRESRSPTFSTKAIRKYQNRAIETAQVIEELIALAKELTRGWAPGRGPRPYGG